MEILLLFPCEQIEKCQYIEGRRCDRSQKCNSFETIKHIGVDVTRMLARMSVNCITIAFFQ